MDAVSLVSAPNSIAVATAPSKTPAITRHETRPVQSRTPAPTAMAKVEVSPNAPGMFPRNASVQVTPLSVSAVSPLC